MGKTRDLFKKTGDIKGISNTKKGTIKDRLKIQEKQKISRRDGKNKQKNCA